jgi:nucleotide-binding universal stress UspA family protein
MNFFDTGPHLPFAKPSSVGPISAAELQQRVARPDAVLMALPSHVPLAAAAAKTLGLSGDIFVVQSVGAYGQKETDLTRQLRKLEDQHPELRILKIHKQTRAERWLHGFVTETLFQKSRWPVLVLRPQALKAAAAGNGFRRILYATDLSVTSVPALLYASALAKQHAGKLFVLQVETAEEGDPFEQQVAQQVLTDWLRGEALEQEESALQEVGCVVRFGTPTQKILETAAELETDMIVLGARGRGAMPGQQGHFVGETAYEVACSSYFPVLIVPEPMASAPAIGR